MSLLDERGVTSNWNHPMSVPTFGALPIPAPIGAFCLAEDSGDTWQWNGVTWVLAIPASGGAGVIAQTRYVDKAGDDTLEDGSLSNPFLTIQRAITSITTAS